MATTSVMGGAVRRREDPALIQGYGEFVDDMAPTDMLNVAFLRSPVARAKITKLDTSAAKEMKGVVAVFTHDDVAHLGPLLAQVPIGKLRPLLAAGEVNHVGEAVAMVVAEDRYQAQDAVEAIDVDYDVLPAVIDLKKAASDEVKVHAELESNVIHTWTYHGYWAALGLEDQTPQVDAAMERDDAVVVSLEMTNQRLIPVAIEPRSVLADFNPGYNCFTVYSSSQVPHALGGAIAKTFGMKSTEVRVIAPEVGGGFGSKLNVYNDEILAAFASQGAGTAGQVDRDPARGCGIHDPRSGLGRDRHPGRNQGWRVPRLQARCHRRHGGIHPELHRRHPPARAVDRLRAVQDARLVDGGMRRDQHDDDGRLSGRGAARGDLLPGAGDRRVRARDRHGSLSRCGRRTSGNPTSSRPRWVAGSHSIPATTRPPWTS